MNTLMMGFGLQALRQHSDWQAFVAFVDYVVDRELNATRTAEDGLPTAKAKARWNLAATILVDIDDIIESALSEDAENKQKGVTNG